MIWHQLRPLLACALLASVGLSVALGGCSVPPEYWLDECDPTFPFPAPDCITDAGSDATPDGAGGAAGGPGVEPQSSCTANGGECVPVPSENQAGHWDDVPLQVWIGPVEDMPDKFKYPGGEKFRLYEGLVAPPMSCSPCSCTLTPGKCEGVPAEISIRAGTCSEPNASTLPFNGPAAWDGSCTDADALPAGAQCPPGSGIPCAQSISYSALPPPAGESCTVGAEPAPTPDDKITTWTTGLVAFAISMDPYTCETTDNYCVPAVLMPYRHCVSRAGKHEVCPANYNYERRVFYPWDPIESRKCSKCACSEPEGGVCVGTVRLYDDKACSSEFLGQPIASLGGDCDPIFPAGRAIGSKAITDRIYMPSTCNASGGEPEGEAIEDAENAVTFCCRMSYVFEDDPTPPDPIPDPPR